MNPPHLYAIEGLDGTGKSTLATSLARELDAHLTCTPPAPLRPLRDSIEAGLNHDPVAVQVFYAATVLAVSAEIRPHLLAGRNVVVDRWWASTLAYAGMRGRSAALDALEPFIVPSEWTIFLDADDTCRRTRLVSRGMSAHDVPTLEPIHAATLRAAFRSSLRHPVCGHSLWVDTSERSPDAVLGAVMRGLRGEERQASLFDGDQPTRHALG